ncbi:MAG: Orotate phosphoribosyltransferase, partial [uncultured Sphingosinicella sp.]
DGPVSAYFRPTKRLRKGRHFDGTGDIRRVPRCRCAAGGAFHPFLRPPQPPLSAMRARADGPLPSRAPRLRPRPQPAAGDQVQDRDGGLACHGRHHHWPRNGPLARSSRHLRRAPDRHLRASPRLFDRTGAKAPPCRRCRHHRPLLQGSDQGRGRRGRRSDRRRLAGRPLQWHRRSGCPLLPPHSPRRPRLRAAEPARGACSSSGRKAGEPQGPCPKRSRRGV